MTPSITLNTLLLPELESELAKIRHAVELVPDMRGEFKSHERSRSLASLAGHTVDLIYSIEMVLTQPEFDFGTEHRAPLAMESREQFLAAFDMNASKTMAAFTVMTNESFLEGFRFLFYRRVVFSGSRYIAYRVNTLDHIIHHRAQLGVYLRLMDLPVPAIYGPSADEAPRYPA